VVAGVGTRSCSRPCGRTSFRVRPCSIEFSHSLGRSRRCACTVIEPAMLRANVRSRLIVLKNSTRPPRPVLGYRGARVCVMPPWGELQPIWRVCGGFAQLRRGGIRLWLPSARGREPLATSCRVAGAGSPSGGTRLPGGRPCALALRLELAGGVVRHPTFQDGLLVGRQAAV
jgi:hypothetical protein